MRAVDTHAHLDFPDFDADRAAVIDQLATAGIGVINIATDVESNQRVVELTKNKLIWGALGLHPHEVRPETAVQLPRLIKDWTKLMSSNKKLVAIGEVGLDYTRTALEAVASQKAALRGFLTFALEIKKPVIFHCRNAYGDLSVMLADYPGLTGVVHCFSGDQRSAKRFLQLGLYLSFTANVTYPNNSELREVMKAVPLDRILLETDSPFLPAQDERGQRNTPQTILKTAELIAGLRGVTREEILNQTLANTKHLFGLRWE